MINFCIKFLICFVKPELPPQKDQKAKKLSKTTKSGLKSKQSNPPISEVPIDENMENNDSNIVKCVGNAREWCQIEYSLLKDILPKVQINVITWGEAAKVYIDDDCRSIKTALINDLVWVYFEVIHKIIELSNEDLVRFKDTKITFTFSQDRKKMMPQAASDCPKKFEFCCDIVDKESSTWFLELHQIDPPDKRYSTFKQKLESFRISRPCENSVVTMINVKQCEKSIELKIHEVSSALPEVDRSLNTSKKGGGKKSSGVKGKKLDKPGKGGEPRIDLSQLVVDSGFLISGMYNVCAERKDITETLRYAGVFVNSSKVLTDNQDITFAPIIVNILTIEALPLKNLQELNVNKVFVRYELANVIDEIETQRFLPNEKVVIDDTRVFFLSGPEEEESHEKLMERPSMIALAEALLTRRFVVKIYGEKELEENEGGVAPCIFGDRPTDPFISTPDHEMFLNYTPPSNTPEVFIGSTCLDLIQLTKGYTTVEACSVLTSSPLSSWDPTCDLTEITSDSQEGEDRKVLLKRFSSRGIIPDSVFFDMNSRVKLKVSSLCRLSVPEDQFLLKIPEVSHRAIIIFKGDCCNDYVVDIIERANNVLLENLAENISINEKKVQFFRKTSSSSSRLSLISQVLSNRLKLNSALNELARDKKQPKTIITGFFVEHEEQSILVFEAMTYVIPPLITQFQTTLNPEHFIRIICDSSIFFTHRLYSKFSPTNIYRIKLAVSLDHLLRTPLFYTQKSLLDESLQTLLLLDLLRRCRTLNSACVNQLFPSCDQLIGFCKVFGMKYDDSGFENQNLLDQEGIQQ